MLQQTRSRVGCAFPTPLRVEMHRRGSNPIIFARTETIHIPKQLENLSQQKLQEAVYRAEDDGSLKQTPLPLIDEEEEEVEMTPKEHKIGVRV